MNARPLPTGDLDALRSLVGRRRPVGTRPHVEHATIDTIRAFARAVGDDNPLFGDESYGRTSVWGSVIAPPLFPIATGSADDDDVIEEPAALALLAGRHVEVVDDEWLLHAVVRPGTRLVRRDDIVAVDTTDLDRIEVTTRSTYSDGPALVAESFRRRAHLLAPPAAAVVAPRAHHDDEALAAIEAAQRIWTRRGALTRSGAEVAVGDEVGPRAVGPLTITDLVAYRAGVGAGPFGVEPLTLALGNRDRRPSFYDRDESNAFDARERLHYDDAYARRHGHPGAYDYSHTRLCWFAHLLTDWMGDGGRLCRIRFERLADNHVGDVHHLAGRIAVVDHRPGYTDVVLSLDGRNQRGETTCRAGARLRLPAVPRWRTPEGAPRHPDW